MSRARILLHPVHLAYLVYRIATAPLHRRRLKRRMATLARDEVKSCWCGGELDRSEWHPSYGVCRACGSYVNQHPPALESLPQLYSLDLYWHGRILSKGQPSIEKRAANDRIDGRVACWLDLIERYGSGPGDVLEIGCGSGVLLAELAERGYRCTGVEPDQETAAWATAETGVEIRAGLFPGIDGLERCDFFLAFNVIEHARDPLAFLTRGAELLRPGGVAIIQAPIDRNPDLKPPFGSKFDSAFDDIEHCFVFTNKSMNELGRRAGLELLSDDRRLSPSNEICAFRKPAA